MRLLLLSSSYVFGHGYLDHSEPLIRSFFRGVRRIGFVPFAAFDHDAYVAKARERLARMDLEVSPVLQPADLGGVDGVFVGGGNTFRLLKEEQRRGLTTAISERVRGGMPYLGSSAGSITACPTIRTTNDMPIVELASLTSLALIPFQLNFHYLDPDPSSTHMGETRETRLREFHEENTTPVLGLREGCALLVDGTTTTLVGEKTARIFRRDEAPFEIPPGPLPDAVLR
jgi:dipeptidase E